MKRINLSVDLEDNQLLEQGVRDALRSYAQQIAREAFNEIIEEEIERVVHNKVASLLRTYYGVKEIEEMAKKAIQDILRDDEQFSERALRLQLAQKYDEFQKLLDQKIRDMDKNFEDKVADKMNSIADESVRMALIRAMVP